MREAFLCVYAKLLLEIELQLSYVISLNLDQIVGVAWYNHGEQGLHVLPSIMIILVWVVFLYEQLVCVCHKVSVPTFTLRI